MLIKGFVHLFAAIILGSTIDRLGRKWVMSWGLFLMSFSLLIFLQALLLQDYYLGVFAAICFKFFYCYGLGGSFMLYQSEILPSHLLPLPNLVYSVLIIFVASFTLYFKDLMGNFIIFFFFFLNGIIGFVLVYGLSVETSGKTDGFIIDTFRKKWFII